jgi:hypothetical protein
MIPILQNGLSMLGENLWEVVAILITSMGLGIWIAHYLTQGRKESAILSLTLATPLGLIGLSITFYALTTIGKHLPGAIAVGSWVLFGVAVFILVCWLLKFGKSIFAQNTILSLTLGLIGFLFLLVLRLAFLKDLLLPPYADSPFHYTLAAALLDRGVDSPLILSGTYYHTGFHTLPAWLTALTHKPLLITLPLLGQLLLAWMPLGVYSLALILSDEKSTARVSALAAAFVWSMPAFASNWGKYPAIAGICLFASVCAAGVLILRSTRKVGVKISVIILLMLGAAFFHTRVLVLAALAGMAFLLTRLPPNDLPKKWIRFITLVVLAGVVVLYFSSPSIDSLYSGDSLFLTIGFAIFLVLAWFQSSRLTLGVGSFILFLFAAQWVPLPALLRLPAETLMDRQFLGMVLFLPLSLVVGIGYSAAKQLLPQKPAMNIGLTSLVVFWIGICAFSAQGYTADACCNFATDSDLKALSWANANLPSGATVYTAAINKEDGLIGSDAGVWVNALTSSKSQLLPFDFAWYYPEEYAAICGPAQAFIYVGGRSTSFQIDPLTHPDWYKLIFNDASTSIYEIIPCQ